MRQRKTARRNRFSLRSSFNLSEHFRVWVTVWVRAAISSGVGQFSLAREWSHFALLETIKGYSLPPQFREHFSASMASTTISAYREFSSSATSMT